MAGNHAGSDLSPWEELSVISISASVGAALLTVATWHKVLTFLVEQQVLVPASSSPMVKIPAGSGIGLDAPRIAIAAAAVVFAIFLAVAAVRRRVDDEPQGRR